jgi:hypothetical protein
MQGQRAVIARERILEPLQPVQRIAPITKCFDEVWPQHKRAIETIQRLVEPVQLIQ